MKRTASISILLFGFLMLLAIAGCNNSTDKKVGDATDSLKIKKDTVAATKPSDKDTNVKTTTPAISGETGAIGDKPVVTVYNFYITNRCASCIAIEEATTKTMNTYFALEVKQGRIKRQILNVDDDANKTVSEKYQVFGSGLFVSRMFKGKETFTDLTGTGFKYAKNKEEKFIELLKKQISDYLK
jgi:hypothetical protein